MKGNTVNDKVKAFYKKHSRSIKIAVAGITLTVVGIAIIINKENIGDAIEDNHLTEEEWDQVMDLARQLDENVAERKALKSK